MVIEFVTREQFADWMSVNVKSHGGIWIRFFKDKKKKSMSADEALDIALCYGWIDGQMKTENGYSYIKYFAPRTENSKWSLKNKNSIERLRKASMMTEYGEEAVRKAVENGQWSKEKNKPDFDKMIAEFEKIIGSYETVLAKYNKVSPSVKKRYSAFYYDAKTEETKVKRLDKIVKALNEDSKGMLY
ncbi:MAG: YdeI/OmpD-associated family protein [Spirochaetes bacterium]|nr:YdeI/OmpD-associated family protein [Spirochaetota bacterium]